MRRRFGAGACEGGGPGPEEPPTGIPRRRGGKRVWAREPGDEQYRAPGGEWREWCKAGR